MEAAIAGAIVAVLLSGLFALQSNMMRMLSASTQTTNASAHLQTRVEQVRLANWPQLTNPNWVQASLLNTPTDADVNLPGLTETYTVTPYQSPSSGAPAATPPPPFTVTRQANGTLKVSPGWLQLLHAFGHPGNASGELEHHFSEPGTHPHAGAMSARFTLGDQQVMPAASSKVQIWAPLIRARRRGCRAFTLVEMMVAATMTAILLVCTLFGVVSLQHSYTSTEEYSAGQADQSRLLDLLALDLRRGIQATGSTTCYAMDPDGQGLQITVPDLYSFSASDTQHRSPLLATPIYDATAETAYYNGSRATVPAGGPYPTQVIAYRFNPANGSITRSDPWAPLVSNGKGGYAAVPMVGGNQHGSLSHDHTRTPATSPATPFTTA